MKAALKYAFVDHWKTTSQGILSLAIALVIAYTSLPAGAKAGVVAVALLKTAVSFLQKDAQ
jgi:hypothetical protein